MDLEQIRRRIEADLGGLGADWERTWEARKIYYYRLVVKDVVCQEKFRSMFHVF